MICHCACIRETAIVRAIADGASTVDDLRARCGAAMDCRGCEATLVDLLDEYQHQSAERVLVRR